MNKKKKFIFVFILLLLIVLSLTIILLASNETPKEKNIETLTDLENAKIGVLLGGVSEQIITEKYPNAELFYYNENMDIIAALQAKQIDVAISGYPTAFYVTKYNTDLKFIEEPLSSDVSGIGLKKGNPLLNDINKFIKSLKEDNTLNEIKSNWFDTNSSEYTIVDISSVATGTPLVIGVAANREPICFLDENGKVTGYDAEIAKRLALYLNRPIEFVDMKYAALIAALQSGKVDMVISNLIITEERKKSIDFSEPYFDTPQMAIVRKTDYQKEFSINSFIDNISTKIYNNLIYQNRYLLILNGLKITLIISLSFLILGTIIGAIVCAFRMSKNRFINSLAKIFIFIFRGIPIVVLLMFSYYVLFSSSKLSPVMVTIITFSMCFGAYIAEILKSGIEAIDIGQYESGMALGFTKFQTFIYIILPQAIKRILPVYKGEYISLIKGTSVVGYIAVQDLTKAGDIIRSKTFEAFFPLLIVTILYFITSWILVKIIDLLEIVFSKKRFNNN